MQNRLLRHGSRQGFTLVELAVVVTIIGLLIGGVLKGKEMIESSRVSSTVVQIKSYETAVAAFKSIYRDLPGDMLNATTRIAGCNAANNCVSGNGDGLVGTGNTGLSWFNDLESSSENMMFWKHLHLANLINAVDPTWSTGATKQFGKSTPISILDSALGYHAKSFIDTLKNQTGGYTETINGLAVVMSIRPDGSWNEDIDSVSPKLAYFIDAKMDDGMASTGSVFAVSTAWGTGCGSVNSGENKSSGYNPGQSERRCDMGFIIQNDE